MAKKVSAFRLIRRGDVAWHDEALAQGLRIEWDPEDALVDVEAVLRAAKVPDKGDMNWGVVKSPGKVANVKPGDWAVNVIDDEPYIVFVRTDDLEG